MAGMVAGGGGSPAWPRLREELRLLPGPAGRNGEPSWTLYDPPAQRFFRLGWLEVEILNRWHLGSPPAIAAAIAAETTLSPHPAMVETVRNFLAVNNLVGADGSGDVARLVKQRRGKHKSLLMAALKNYLFIRIPLVKPDGFLDRTVGDVRWLFTRPAAVFFALVALMGFYLVGRQWEMFTDSFSSLLSFRGGMLAMLALIVSKSFHELGHAYASKSLGLRVPSMGVSLMCFAPVLWTDTTEAWKLVSRRDRLFIGVSGVYSELILASLAAAAWPVLPPGAMKTAAFITASSAWILTLTVNINPCMRYDGYYLLSDYWNVPGLQTRSFALAKWWLREWLFGLGLPPPEVFPAWDRRKLIVYAFVTWVYRFFLFIGIALLVYHLFFKALGVVLMVVELLFFIALPIGMEVMHWVKLRKHFTLRYRLVRSLVVGLALLFFFIYPWHSRVDGPGVAYAERQALFFAPIGGVVEAVGAANGQAVETGDVLFRLRSPDLDAKIALAGQKVAAQRLKLSFASLDAALRAEMTVEWEELERLAEDLGGLLAVREDLEIRAAFSGLLNDIPPWLQTGSMVGGKEGLGILTGGGSLVAVYVSEADWSRIGTGNSGRFYPSGLSWKPVSMTVVMVDNQTLPEVPYPEVASVHGGPLPTHRDSDGKLIPEHAVYRILCRVEDDSFNGRFVTGHASLEATPRSLASIIWNNFLGVLIRESNF